MDDLGSGNLFNSAPDQPWHAGKIVLRVLSLPMVSPIAPGASGAERACQYADQGGDPGNEGVGGPSGGAGGAGGRGGLGAGAGLFGAAQREVRLRLVQGEFRLSGAESAWGLADRVAWWQRRPGRAPSGRSNAGAIGDGFNARSTVCWVASGSVRLRRVPEESA